VGTGWNILQVPAAAFAPMSNTIAYTISDEGYLHYGGSTVPFIVSTRFVAPVQLPSGAAIGYVGLYASDYATSAVVAQLRRHTGWGSEPQCTLLPLCPPRPPAYENLAQISSTGSSGAQYVYATLLPMHTVVNNRLLGGGQYVVIVDMQVSSLNTFKAVDIWWKRQISPPPATARFTDVPLGAAFFAEVEALAASGITLGCTATEFCPEFPLTRRQMAAFLARALGLYYQY